MTTTAQSESGQILPRAFYLDEDVVGRARQLLGKVLCTNFGKTKTSGMIVETEAYRGPDDKACHAYDYRRTARTEAIYAVGGTAYIYLCYGIHHLFNVVTGPEDVPHAILIRGIEPLEGIPEMLKRRGMQELSPRVTAGPGMLSSALGLHTSQTGSDLTQSDGEKRIWIEDRGIELRHKGIIASPRVGVQYAGECASWPWRFRLSGSKWTSKAK